MVGRRTRFERVDGEIPRRIRRPMAILAIAGYPSALIVWLFLGPKIDAIPGLGAILGLLILAVTMFAMYRLYLFRSKMAQAPDEGLDERQRQIRDRAYVDSYRWFVLITLLTLVALSLGPTLFDAPIEFTFEVANWCIVGVVLISIALPSAVVAWREPDLED